MVNSVCPAYLILIFTLTLCPLKSPLLFILCSAWKSIVILIWSCGTETSKPTGKPFFTTTSSLSGLPVACTPLALVWLSVPNLISRSGPKFDSLKLNSVASGLAESASACKIDVLFKKISFLAAFK